MRIFTQKATIIGDYIFSNNPGACDRDSGGEWEPPFIKMYVGTVSDECSSNHFMGAVEWCGGGTRTSDVPNPQFRQKLRHILLDGDDAWGIIEVRISPKEMWLRFYNDTMKCHEDVRVYLDRASYGHECLVLRFDVPRYDGDQQEVEVNIRDHNPCIEISESDKMCCRVTQIHSSNASESREYPAIITEYYR